MEDADILTEQALSCLRYARPDDVSQDVFNRVARKYTHQSVSELNRMSVEELEDLKRRCVDIKEALIKDFEETIDKLEEKAAQSMRTRRAGLRDQPDNGESYEIMEGLSNPETQNLSKLIQETIFLRTIVENTKPFFEEKIPINLVYPGANLTLSPKHKYFDKNPLTSYGPFSRPVYLPVTKPLSYRKDIIWNVQCAIDLIIRKIQLIKSKQYKKESTETVQMNSEDTFSKNREAREEEKRKINYELDNVLNSFDSEPKTPRKEQETELDKALEKFEEIDGGYGKRRKTKRRPNKRRGTRRRSNRNYK
jgi:hypothetical protein